MSKPIKYEDAIAAANLIADRYENTPWFRGVTLSVLFQKHHCVWVYVDPDEVKDSLTPPDFKGLYIDYIMPVPVIFELA